MCLNWDTTVEWCNLLELEHVPVLYRGIWKEEAIRDIHVDTSLQEGYVVRTADSFMHDDFRGHVAKWVRSNHVSTDEHWMHRKVVPNELGED